MTQDFEVICVNDGSTDSSADTLSEYEKRYPELVVIEEENRGGAGARNCGLQKAEGKYLFFLDADDFLPQGVLQKLLDLKQDKSFDKRIYLFYPEEYRVFTIYFGDDVTKEDAIKFAENKISCAGIDS